MKIALFFLWDFPAAVNVQLRKKLRNTTISNYSIIWIINNPVVSFLDMQALNYRVPEEAWQQINKIRDAVFTTIRDLSPRHFSFVITHDMVDGEQYPQIWNKLAERLKVEGSEVVTKCHRLKLQAEDGKMRETDVADIETLLRLIQSVPSKKAKPIKL
jgi:hypothetical protein